MEARLPNMAQGTYSMFSGLFLRKCPRLLRFFCQIFSFVKFTFGLEPEFYIPSYRPVVFFLDFPGALPNFHFVGLSQSAGSLSQLLRQSQYVLHRFPIATHRAKLRYLLAFSTKLATRCF
jgi:hypothetical protein